MITYGRLHKVKLSWLLFLIALSTFSLLISQNIQVLFPKHIGFRWLGSIAEKNGGVILIKEIESQKVRALRVKDVLLEKYTITKIQPKSIKLKDNQDPKAKLLTIYKKGFGPKGGVTSVPKQVAKKEVKYAGSYKEDGFEREGQEIKVSSKYKDHMIKNNLKDILMSASATPEMRDGELVGFIIDDIEPSSIFEKMGIQNLDIITAINGNELDDIANAVKTLRGLQGETSAEFELEREGTKFTVKIDVQ